MTSTFGRPYNDVSPFMQFLTVAGDGTGSVNANGNYAGAPADFRITPLASEELFIGALGILVADNGKAQIEDYGAIMGGLTVGLDIRTDISGIERSLVAPGLAKNNAGLLALGSVQFGVMDDDTYIRVILDFRQLFGVPLVMRGAEDALIVRLNDDLTGLHTHKFMVFGARGL